MTQRLVRRVGAWVPLVGTVRTYRRAWLRFDLIAGLSLWALAVPQALAYAQLAGLPAVVGLYTALAGALIYGVLGTTRAITVGPESTVALIVAGAVGPLAAAGSSRYLALTGLLALLTGVFLMLGAVVRAGVITRFLSAPVLTGYLAGAGIVIMVGQVPKALGFEVTGSHATKLGGVVAEIGKTDPWAVALSVGTVVLTLLARRYAPRAPGALMALAVATVLVATTPLRDRVAVVGEIGSGSLVGATLDFGALHWADIGGLAPTALSIAVFVFATTALTAKAIDPDQSSFDSRREFVALGATNLASAAIGGYPTNSSDTRSFFLAQSGSRTQLANIVCGALVMVTLLALTPLFTYLPSAALAGVILVTAIRLIDVAAVRRLARLKTLDLLLAVVTAVGVLLVGPILGIAVGVIASLLAVVARTIQPRTSVLAKVPGPTGAWRDAAGIDTPETIPGVIVYRFDAPIFFANVDVLRAQVLDLVDTAGDSVYAVVISAEGVTDLDVTGAEGIVDLAADLAARRVMLSFARLRSHVRDLMERAGVFDALGGHAVHLRVADAVDAAVERRGRSHEADTANET